MPQRRIPVEKTHFYRNIWAALKPTLKMAKQTLVKAFDKNRLVT